MKSSQFGPSLIRSSSPAFRHDVISSRAKGFVSSAASGCVPARKANESSFNFGSIFRQGLMFFMLLGFTQGAQALSELEDSQLSKVSGTGIALGLDDFRFAMAPTSYIELTGSTPSAGWNRGDVRYYGLSITGNGPGTDWYGDGCGGSSTVLCPLGVGVIDNLASVYNPYVLRAFQYDGYDRDGNLLTGAARPTVLELVGPSQSDSWRWSFWGEIEVARGGACPAGGNAAYCGLQSQTVILGKPTTVGRQWNGGNSYSVVAPEPAILRLMKTADSADSTLGFTYQSALSGDFRFSVAQLGAGGALHEVPNFNDVEGVQFRNVDAFLPLGRLNSQAITLDDAGGDGNFTIELTSIPNIATVYNDIYCGNGGGCAISFGETVDFFGNGVDAIAAPNVETHGYIRWGDFAQPYTASNGISFVDPAGNTTYLGVARMEGMLVQHMKLTTKGAGL